MAVFNLPDDLSTAEVGELESFETIVFMELSRFKQDLATNADTEVPDEKLEQITALSQDLKAIRAELANRSDAKDAKATKQSRLDDAFALLDVDADTDSGETEEVLADETPEVEAVEAPAEEAEVLADETEAVEAPVEEAEVLEVAAEVAEAPASNQPVINLTVNVASNGETTTALTDDQSEEIVAEEVLADEATEEAPEAEALEAAAEVAEETPVETEEVLATDETGGDEEEAPAEVLATEGGDEEEAPAEALSEEAPAAEETTEETPVEEEALEAEAATETEDLTEETLEDVSDDATVEADEATEVLDDATATNTQTQDMPVSSDNEVEEMQDTLNSELQHTEVEAPAGNATMHAAVDGMNYASAALGGGDISNYSDVTKVFSTAYEALGGSNQWRGVRQGTSEFMRLVSVESDRSDDILSLGLTNEVNTSVLEQAADKFVAQRAGQTEGIVASGGICAPCPVDFSLNRIAVAFNPIESSLPVVRAQRGCYAYTRRVNWTQAAREGIAVITPADDRAGYVSTPGYAGGPGPTPDKPCVTVPCPDTDRKCCIEAIWWCMRIGNFQMITWPEHIDAFLQDLLVAFAAEKEANYLFKIDAASVVSFSNALGYNLRSNILWIMRNALINYRKALHLPLEGGARMTALIPDWLVEAIKQDYSNSTDGLDSLSTQDVDRWFRNNLNIDPTYFYDGIACGDPEDMMAQCKADGEAVAEFPAEAAIYFWNPGDIIRLFTTTLDFGLVRDHILNSTNDAILAAEEFTSLCIKEPPCKIVFPVCPSGAHPPRAAAPVCGHNAAPAAFAPPAGNGNLPFCAEPMQDGPGSICNDPAMYSDIVCPPAPVVPPAVPGL